MKTIDQVKPIAGDLNETSHTPGPWIVDYSGPARIAIADTMGNEVALCSMQCECGDTDEANARLIASAPELLAALEHAAKLARIELEQFLEDGWQPESMAVAAIRQNLAVYETAVAKAKGEISTPVF